MPLFIFIRLHENNLCYTMLNCFQLFVYCKIRTVKIWAEF